MCAWKGRSIGGIAFGQDEGMELADPRCAHNVLFQVLS